MKETNNLPFLACRNANSLKADFEGDFLALKNVTRIAYV